jgi:hypothetical protein
VLGVVTVRGLAVDLAQVHGHDGEPLALEPPDHLTGHPASYGVGLDQDQRSLAHGARA